MLSRKILGMDSEAKPYFRFAIVLRETFHISAKHVVAFGMANDSLKSLDSSTLVLRQAQPWRDPTEPILQCSSVRVVSAYFE
jgi:hypothetical protein